MEITLLIRAINKSYENEVALEPGRTAKLKGHNSWLRKSKRMEIKLNQFSMPEMYYNRRIMVSNTRGRLSFITGCS